MYVYVPIPSSPLKGLVQERTCGALPFIGEEGDGTKPFRGEEGGGGWDIQIYRRGWEV